VTFADPFLVESWAGIKIDGLPSLREQLQLFRDDVMSRPKGTSSSAANSPSQSR
jgi:hypothetical protein